MTDVRKGVLATVVAAALLGAGCGGDDLTISEAKAKLSKDCQQGKKEDKRLCDCMANELEAKGKSAKEIDDIRKKVNEGERAKEILAAAQTCGRKLAAA